MDIMTEPKKIKVQFAPGAFDDFEGTQEELDEFVKEINDMFTNMTPEELEKRSRPVDFDELFDEDPEIAEQLVKHLQDLDDDEPRKLN